ncbi:methyltransferase domain-containing protein [Nocardiopsis ansamitocini]|uniref:Protein-L-isoaspartate O-methyltransferase n=1 Tax=Nocardiopsis ansamitocini TaxID=1670832 RepID=A0A9W6P283_9ACTN|nr:methyltransferase domain-containing protein [Nocardiopsis ansamitocini]GLU45895.1 protein-L-isoaspartate O-methyltransferase [Nocardiopsis ansamitocini]
MDHVASAARLVEVGGLSARWRPVLESVRRDSFLPDTVWDASLRPVVRSREPGRWSELVHRDAPVITQLDDGGGSGRGYVSSSASMPSVVALMLGALALDDGMTVLEIGTGTGWNAALLAARLGDDRVTTVEVDAALAERARVSLAAAGVDPLVVTADGTAGWPARAPYDRVIATAAVRWVPYAWVEQTRPGGRVVTPFGTAFHNGTLLLLDVADDGTASGRFGAGVGFMWVRDQRTPHGSVEDRVDPVHDFTETVTGLHPYEPVSGFDASFAIGLRVSGMLSTVVHDDSGDGFTVYLMDPGTGADTGADTGSWARWRITADTVGEYRVRQHGPRRLFDELRAAYDWWLGLGKPAHDRFGLTVDADGQRAWLDDPGREVGPVG